MCATTQNAAVINTGSMAAVAANPEQCSYVATKHALLGFSMSAFEVLRHHGCKVCIINPGAEALVGCPVGPSLKYVLCHPRLASFDMLWICVCRPLAGICS